MESTCCSSKLQVASAPSTVPNRENWTARSASDAGKSCHGVSRQTRLIRRMFAAHWTIAAHCGNGTYDQNLGFVLEYY
jgi:hypothetical protein